MEGVGNWIDYGMRAYDPRIGRFPSVDPLTAKYPWYSPYQYAGDKPVWKRDIDGLEEEDADEVLRDREELYRRADQSRLREALKDEDKEKDPEELKDPLKSFNRLRTWFNNYTRNGFNSAQQMFGGSDGSRDVTRAIDNFIARQRGAALPKLNNSTALEEEVKIDATLARATPGTVTGKGKAIVGQWLRGSQGNAGYVPESVAKSLRGQNFKSFDDFRQAFWKEVAKTPELASQFDSRNQALMQKGFAPYPIKEQTNGGQQTYQLHHSTPIQRGGAVYDVDNIMIVTPAYHKEVLSPTYHY